MFTDWWQPAEEILHQHPPSDSTAAQSISSYFKRPSKITKPNSRNQSPRTKGRRRMTTQFPLRTRSVVDTHKTDVSSRQRLFDQPSSARPLSWHPAMNDDFSHYQESGQHYMYPYDQLSQFTTLAYGLVTPITYPAEVEPYTQCANIPLDQLTEQDYHQSQSNFAAMDPYRQVFIREMGSYAAIPPAPVETMEYTNPSWSSLPFANNYDNMTAPTSPNFLPVPDMGQPFDFPDIPDVDEEKEELVGMGLYDFPGQAQTSTVLFGVSPTKRKCLKLEESFEPPLDDCDADDAESESISADDNSWQQEESNPVDSNAANQQIKAFPDYSEKPAIYQGTEPYLVRDFTTSQCYSGIEGVCGPPYGWI